MSHHTRLIHRSLITLAVTSVGLLGSGCTDAGGRADASTSDAALSAMDATAPDAGSSAPDAAAPDAPTSDATPPTPDAMAPDAGPPPMRCRGYSTRYWDCCKAHCGWSDNVDEGVTPVTSCDQANRPQPGMYVNRSACDAAGPSSSHTCFSMRPWSVSDTLSYGFAAVPAAGAICGRCYQLEFDGTGHYDASDPGSSSLRGKTMIVQATNIGYDVAGGQFDLLIPGGGVGLFDACTVQWGVSDPSALGATYGGLLTRCREAHSAHDAVKSCVRSRCASLFGDAGLSDLLAGCNWFVDWFDAADNPNLDYFEVACPDAIVAVSGVDRRPLDDLRECGM